MTWQRLMLARARKVQAMADANARLQAEYAAAKAVWAPFCDENHLPAATLPGAWDAWHAAIPYEDIDAEAARALAGAEEVLRRENPAAMGRYDMRVASGWSRLDAMTATVPDWAWDRISGARQSGHEMTEADARALYGALTKVADASMESVRAGRGPLSVEESVTMVQGMKDLPPGMAGRIAEGLSEGTILLGPASPSIADTGAPGLCWEGGTGRRVREQHAGRRRRGGRKTAKNRTKKQRQRSAQLT